MLINVTDSVYKKAFDYVEVSRTSGGSQVAVHCRRGDHKYMNCGVHVEENRAKAFEIQMQWEEGDSKLQEINLRTDVQYCVPFSNYLVK